LDIPFEVLEHLEALLDCEDALFKTCLRLGREGKLWHFEALGRYDIPSEVLGHLEALSNFEGGQFNNCLRLGREGKLRNFEALCRYKESKIMHLWQYMISQNGGTR
jgi:hypothetical protein